MNEVEIIVLDLDGGAITEQCILSIANQEEKPSRVILFDNGSQVPLQSRLPAFVGIDLQVIRSDSNVGFTGGINAAMSDVRSPFVGWINNDVVLHPRWLTALRSALEQNPRLAAVQPIIVSLDGRVDGAGIRIDDGTFQQHGHGQSLDQLSSTAPWGISATASMFRMEALEQVRLAGGFLHPDLFAYFEDVELSARLREAGWSMELVDEVLATHRGSFSATRIGGKAARLRVRNRYFVHRLHPEIGRLPALLWEDIRAIVKLLTTLHALRAVSHSLSLAEGLLRTIRTGGGPPGDGTPAHRHK